MEDIRRVKTPFGFNRQQCSGWMINGVCVALSDTYSGQADRGVPVQALMPVCDSSDFPDSAGCQYHRVPAGCHPKCRQVLSGACFVSSREFYLSSDVCFHHTMCVNKKTPHSYRTKGLFLTSGPKETRTLDLFNAIEALSQLSYRPT